MQEAGLLGDDASFMRSGASGDARARARTPIELLCLLAEEGRALGLDLWGMATDSQRAPAIYACTVAPMDPAALNTHLAHFIISASSLLSSQSTETIDWNNADQQAVCLHPSLKPLSGSLADHRDVGVPICGETDAVIRAAALEKPESPRTPVSWEQANRLVQAAIPHLRSLVAETGQTDGILDKESGTYAAPYFLDSLEREIERARCHLVELSLAVLNLQPAGLLGEIPPWVHSRVGSHLGRVVRRTDMVGRIRSRSYAIFFYNTGPRGALMAAGRMADVLNSDEAIKRNTMFSLGVSGWELNGLVDVPTLLLQASKAAQEAAAIAPGRAFVHI